MKPFDITKFKKEITKSLDTISTGFNDPTDWISTGNFALNYRISRDFTKGIPLGKVTMFAGESGSGKSFIVSGNAVRNAQEQGVFVVLIDSENALDESWLRALGVDTSEDKLLRISASMIDDVAKIISDFMKDYKANYAGTKPEERPKVLFVIDSLGMLMTPTDVNQFEDGNMKGDMGRKPKALAALVRNCVNMFGEWNIGLIATQHSYASQDMFDPDDKITGGQGFIYASSIVVAMRKYKLKEDDEGNKVTNVRGIRSSIKVMKTRYAKPFEQVEVKIPYESGMDPYSGLIEFFEADGLLVKEGNKLKYIALDGSEHKYFRKQISRDLMDRMMSEYPEQVRIREAAELAEARAAREAELLSAADVE
jgi:recombination protein RecA